MSLPLRLALAATAAGSAAGLFFSGVQSIDSLPLLMSAEHFDLYAHNHSGATLSPRGHLHDSAAHPPADLMLRTLFRFVSDAVIGIGFAMILCAAIFLHNHHTHHPTASAPMGIIWGLAGYLTFYLAPALIYPPRTPATDLLTSHHDISVWKHQLTWLCAALSTGVGLALIAYGDKTKKLTGGLLLLALPVLVSFNSDPLHTMLDQHRVTRLIEVTEQHYRYSAHLSNLLFWLALGVLSAYTTGRAVSDHPTTEPEPEP
nr:CbtA family protein [Motiliproteus sediminis]